MKLQKHVSVILPKELCDRLDVLAEESCRSRAGYLRQLLREYLRYIEQHPEEKLR